MFVPEAYITATRQFVAQANNWSLEELTLEVTSFFFSFLFFFFFFFILSFLFFPFPPPPTPLFFIRLLLLSLIEKNSTKDSAVFIFNEKGGVLRLLFIVGLFIVNVTKVTFLPIVLYKRSLQ